MDGQKLRITKQGREAMAVLAQLRDKDAALLYAYVAAQDGGCTPAQAAQALDYSPEALKKASQLLLVYNLAAYHTAPPPRAEITYPAQELAQVRQGDPVFSGLCDYFETVKGTFLNRRELETLLNVYQALGLPPEVLTLLMSDCAKRGRLTAREVEKQAYRWYDLGLDNYEAAGAYLENQRLRQTRGGKILAMMGIHDRLPVESEQKYIDQWIEMGLPDELLARAYDATVLGTGRMSWPYMHKVLLNWKQAGYRTAADVEQHEGGGRKSAAAQAAPRESAETVILRKMQEKRQQRALELENRRAELRESSPAFLENESAMRLFASRMARARASEKAQMAREYQGFVAKQSELLQQLGKPTDWLADKPDCPLCGDRGYVGTQRCRCLEQALAAAGV